MVGSEPDRRVATITLWVIGVSVALALLALAGLGASQRASMRAQAARVVKLEQRVAELSADQRLLAAMVEAGVATDSPRPSDRSAQATTAGEQQPVAPGTTRIFGSIRAVAKKPYGWELSVDPSEYVTGTAAFSLASSMGKLTNEDGSFVLDTSDRVSRLKLLSDAKVTVTSWPGEPKGALATITTQELAKVLPGGASATREWAKAWFWLDVKDGYVLQVTQQSVK